MKPEYPLVEDCLSKSSYWVSTQHGPKTNETGIRAWVWEAPVIHF